MSRLVSRSTGMFALAGIVAALACATGSPPLDVTAAPQSSTLAPAPLPAPLSERERAIHLLSRTTYGVRPQDVEEVQRLGLAGWLEQQLHPERIDDDALEPHLDRVKQAPAAGNRGVFTFVTPVAPAPVPTPAPQAPGRSVAQTDVPQQQERMLSMARTVVLLRGGPDQSAAQKLARAVHSERQLEEVMTDFWFNHFNVFATKDRILTVLDDYEQTAIRAHVFGRFEDMLVAVAQHPAMLMYLDNFLSSAPGTSNPAPLGGLARAQTIGGLNENYARELLELHTIGVDGGYTQRDVIETARAFTGWSVRTDSAGGGPVPPGFVGGLVIVRAPGGGPGELRQPNIEFDFQADRHDTDEKEVLGHTLQAGRGMEDGLDVLRMLAQHPSTAEHIARKLVRHFVADEPPPTLVGAIAFVFRETGGDLRAVTRALLSAEAFYDPAHAGAKVKRPFEFVASALRATGAEIDRPAALLEQLRALGHFPYLQSAPTGYPVTQDAWVSAGAMLTRAAFALDLAAGRVDGVQLPSESPGDALPEAGGATNLAAGGRASTSAGTLAAEDLRPVVRATLKRVLPAAPADLEDEIVQGLAGPIEGDARAAGRDALGAALASPAFQRH